MQEQIEQILIDRNQIAKRVRELADQIAADYRHLSDEASEDLPLVLIAIMTGSVIFLADLVRCLPMMMRMKLISVSSYPGTALSSQGVTITDELPDDLAGKHVLIVDDILDSGKTLMAIRSRVQQSSASSVRTCVLLRKDRPSARATPSEYVGFDIPDQFVVGYGLDYDDLYRNLPDVVTLRDEVIA